MEPSNELRLAGKSNGEELARLAGSVRTGESRGMTVDIAGSEGTGPKLSR
jgi:hypothetical protein